MTWVSGGRGSLSQVRTPLEIVKERGAEVGSLRRASVPSRHRAALGERDLLPGHRSPWRGVFTWTFKASSSSHESHAMDVNLRFLIFI